MLVEEPIPTTTPGVREALRSGNAASNEGFPLTERILGALPGPRNAWVVLWALLGPIRVLALLVVLNLTRAHPPQALVDAAVNTWILGYVAFVALWANPRLCGRVGALAPTLRRIAPSQAEEGWSEAISSIRGPIALTVAALAVSVPSTFGDFGPTIAAMDIVLLPLVLLPIMTLVWEYGTLLYNLDRLGRADLVLDQFPEDRGLGLGPVGSVAMSGLWPLLIAGIPVLLLAGSDLPSLITSTTVLGITLGLFALSMLRLHGQLRAAKSRYVSLTRALVADAFAPVRDRSDLETLQTASSALSAAQSLADRAEKILEWPIDERMVTSLTVVVTGVITSLAVKVLLQAVGA